VSFVQQQKKQEKCESFLGHSSMTVVIFFMTPWGSVEVQWLVIDVINKYYMTNSKKKLPFSLEKRP